jgi:hypothetical protein
MRVLSVTTLGAMTPQGAATIQPLEEDILNA